MVSPPEDPKIVDRARNDIVTGDDLCDGVAGKKCFVNSESAVLTGQRSCTQLRAPW
jgi:hypothetical protein